MKTLTTFNLFLLLILGLFLVNPTNKVSAQTTELHLPMIANVESDFSHKVLIEDLGRVSRIYNLDGRIYIVELTGLIWEYTGITLNLKMDISDVVATSLHVGLMGIAIDSCAPNKVYVDYLYQAPNGDQVMRISEFTGWDTSTEVVLMEEVSNFTDISTHKGGDLQFNDCILYNGYGDGKYAGWVDMHSQLDNTVLGKFIAIRTDGSCLYLVSTTCEISRGWRHPWDFAIYENGTPLFHIDDTVFVSEVGQHTTESVVSMDRWEFMTNQTNMGWPCYEGGYKPYPYVIDPTNICGSISVTNVDVFHTYTHRDTSPNSPYESCNGAVIGASIVEDVYLGNRLQDVLVFADYCYNELYVKSIDGPEFKTYDLSKLTGQENITALHAYGSPSGEIYVLSSHDAMPFVLDNATTIIRMVIQN